MEESKFTSEEMTYLARPFPTDVLAFRPGATTKDRKSALALCYVDRPTIEARLNEVLLGEWSFRITPIVVPNTHAVIIGSLDVRGLVYEDIGEAEEGSASEQWKAATTDAFKRCCTMLGIGRYLSTLPQVWVPYDEIRKRFAEDPVKYIFEGKRAEAQIAYTDISQDTERATTQQVCSECSSPISDKVAGFSESRFKRLLCMPCQKAVTE